MAARSGRWCLLALCVSVMAAPARAAAGDQRTTFARVRSGTAEVVNLLAEGYGRSATFRRLVDTLEQTPVLVYVQPGRCRRNDAERLTGCMFLVGDSQGVRHLRIVVNTAGPRDRVLATIGHELQHAVESSRNELAADPQGHQQEDQYLVRRGVLESDAARRVTEAILKELRAANPRMIPREA